MDRRTLAFVGVLLSSFLTAQGASRVDAHERAKRFGGSIPSLERRGEFERPFSVRDMLRLTASETLDVSDRAKTAQGRTIWRLSEKYKNLKVFDVSVSVTTDQSGHLTGHATGSFFQDIDKDIPSLTPGFSSSEALEVAIRAADDDENRWDVTRVKIDLIVFVDKKSLARLAYKVEYLLLNDMIQKRPVIIIDAKNRENLLSWDNLDTIRRIFSGIGGNQKVGKITYGESNFQAPITQIGNQCFLENEYAKVVDMKRTALDNITDSLIFECTEGFNDSINGAYSPASDALYFGYLTTRMFVEWYNMKPLKEQVVLRVHFMSEYENAFWDGKSCTFGDGAMNYYPLVFADIVAHEIAHGLTEQHSGLLYFGESGSINEAFSDMTGETIEAFYRENDWYVGYDIYKGVGGLRYFENPEQDNASISHAGDFVTNMDPHYGSGVYRAAFYFLVHELGLPIRYVYQVFLYTNRLYWHEKTSFDEGACDVLKAAYDLGQDVSAFASAFRSVGVAVCDVLQHIQSLRNNISTDDVTVGPDSQPIFAFEIPEWGENVTVRASSQYGTVFIQLRSGRSLEAEHLRDEGILVEGATSVFVEELPTLKTYIQLSANQTLRDVSLMAGYLCKTGFESPYAEIYRWKCFGELG